MAGRGGGASRPNGATAANKICQFKLVLLGESAVGKSSLVLRFVKGQFHEFQESTIGGRRHTTAVIYNILKPYHSSYLLCFALLSCLPHPDGLSGRHHSEVWDLGHGGSRALPQPGSNVLQRSPGSHRGLRHYQHSRFQAWHWQR